jgi:adenylate cyclase class 2
MIEIEKKYRVLNFDTIRSKLASGDFDVMGDAKPEFQSDEYFNHRQLRFELKDIALRIRQVDDKFVLTFKGPNQDATTKIRTEVEVAFNEENAGKMSEMFIGMGMHAVAKVCKTRDTISIRWQGSNVEVCLDTVDEVGCFVELEIVAEKDDEVSAAKEKLEALAKKFGLEGSITTSYLEMLLEARGQL